MRGKLTRRDMLKLSGGTLAGAGLLGLAGCGSGGSSSSSSASKTLTLGALDWAENIAVSNLTKVVLEGDLGYSNVQVQGPLELGLIFQGVASGDLHAFQDVWLPNHEVYLNKPQVENDVELLDPWYEGTTAFGITVPNYMEGITSIADLPNAGTDEITGIEPSAAFMPVIENDVIPAYNLDMKLVTSSTAGMLSELQKAYDDQEPIVFTGWSPHWMNTEYDFRYLDDPKNAQGAFDDPSRITCVVNENLKDDDPQAYAFLRALSLSEEQINQIEAEMQEAGTSSEAQLRGVRNWYEKNRGVAQPWIDAAKQA